MEHSLNDTVTGRLKYIEKSHSHCHITHFSYKRTWMQIKPVDVYFTVVTYLLLIQKTWVCDGIHDCSRGEDESKCEFKCEENQFRCGNVSSYNSTSLISRSNLACIAQKHVCDGKRDCLKGEGKTYNHHRSVTTSQTLRMWFLFQSQHSCCPLRFNVDGHAISILVFLCILWKPVILHLCWD